ncbi:hypothetical protein P7K49_026841 [Saguinus oedipus]|uniref:Uncharacterized protein n=1 Tax=Saguinus oedipus TaxID=9490 RepID=A0ABQ9UF82_SAGOE|nr:hypothetical protein P7K49_026841 [Saguinus oedipus]
MPRMAMRQSLRMTTSPLLWSPTWMVFGTWTQDAPGILYEIQWREDPVFLQLLLGSLGALGPACCHVLSELSEEWVFHVSYLDIKELSLSGLCQCLVELST